MNVTEAIEFFVHHSYVSAKVGVNVVCRKEHKGIDSSFIWSVDWISQVSHVCVMPYLTHTLLCDIWIGPYWFRLTIIVSLWQRIFTRFIKCLHPMSEQYTIDVASFLLAVGYSPFVHRKCVAMSWFHPRNHNHCRYPDPRSYSPH